MNAKATTIRFDPKVKHQLTKLSKLLGKSVNLLTNDAVREYVLKQTIDAEQELEEMLEDLRAYRKSDPVFKRANDEFVAAEVSLTDREDPAQGEIYIEAETETETEEKTVRAMLHG
jgi:predicted transcriptional regulator